MTSRVEILQLGQTYGEDVWAPKSVSIDFDTLTEYKGDGKCREVHCNHVCIGWSDDDSDDSSDSFANKKKWIDATSAQTWAEKMNWDIQTFPGGYLLSKKN